MWLLFLLVFCCAPVSAQENTAIQTLSQEIHAQLDGLRQQSRHLTEQLLIAESELHQSSLQAETLKAELTGLNTCLDATNAKLSDYSERLTVYEERLRSQRKWILRGAVLIILAVLIKLAVVILRFKGIRLADWINILA